MSGTRFPATMLRPQTDCIIFRDLKGVLVKRAYLATKRKCLVQDHDHCVVLYFNRFVPGSRRLRSAGDFSLYALHVPESQQMEIL